MKKGGINAFFVFLSIVLLAVLVVSYSTMKADMKALKEDVKASSNTIKSLQDQVKDYEKLKSENKDLKKKNEELSKEMEIIQKANAEKEGVTYSKAKTVYLTFDDGPSANTLKVLKILDEYNIKATFFVINNGQDNAYMKNIVDAGHQIALHSYTHEYSIIYRSTEAFFNDLDKISGVVKEQTGVDAKICRFPGGTSNTVSRKYCSGIMTTLQKQVADKGYKYFDWNVDSTDASGNNVSVSKIVANATAGTKYSSDTLIVLMHDTNAKSTTVEALPAIIKAYLKIGAKFDVITEDTPMIQFKPLN